MLYDFETTLYRTQPNGDKLEKKIRVKYDSEASTFSVRNLTDEVDVAMPSKIVKDYNGKRQELPALDALIIGQLPIWAGGQIFETEMTVEGWTKDDLKEKITALPETTKDEVKFKGKCEFLLDEKGGLKKIYGFLQLSPK